MSIERRSGILDAHAHLAPGPEALKRLLATMDREGVARAVVVGGGLISPKKLNLQIASQPTRAETEGVNCDHWALLAQCDLAQGRLLPFYFANPWADPSEYRGLGARFHGLKLGPAVHGVPLLDSRTWAYIEIARELGHPVYLHCLDRRGFRVGDLVTLAEKYPSVRFILGHGGIGQMDFECAELIAPQMNISYETSGAFQMAVKNAVDKLGPERVFFGSEYPISSARAEIAKLEDMGLSPESLLAIFGGNLCKLLGALRVEPLGELDHPRQALLC